MTYQLNSDDLVDYLYNLRQPLPGEKHMHHPLLGNLSFVAHQMPHLQAIELDMGIPHNRLHISNTSPNSGKINISFQLEGSMVSRFAGIRPLLDMKTGVHNLIYLPVEHYGDLHVMEGNQNVSVLQIEVDKQYYLQCLHNGDAWSENLIGKVEQELPLSASEVSLIITPRMRQLIQSIKEDKGTGPMKMLLFQSRLFELLALQVEQFSDMSRKEQQRPGADDMQKLYLLKEYIDRHFLSDLSLSGLSRACCLNEFKLKKGFKAEFGETVFGYVRKLRMQYAGRLLRDTSYSIDEVAATLGYEHAHHFSKAFENFTGCLPSHFKG